MDPLVIKQFDPVLVEAIDCEQKKAGDITYTSVKFGYDGGKVPPIRINGEFKLFNFKGNYSLSTQCDDDEKAKFFEKLEEMIARETCRYLGSKKLKPEELKLVKLQSLEKWFTLKSTLGLGNLNV